MAMRARPPDLRGDPAAAAALRMLFECGWDYFDDASVHFGVAYSDYEGLRKLARRMWPLYGRQFLNNRLSNPNKPVPWARKRFGQPE